MACSKCASAQQREFPAELTLAFGSLDKINQAPVYVCQKALVCLNCGYTEVVVPAPQLEQLKKDELT
jgi:hypothetical protein